MNAPALISLLRHPGAVIPPDDRANLTRRLRRYCAPAPIWVRLWGSPGGFYATVAGACGLLSDDWAGSFRLWGPSGTEYTAGETEHRFPGSMPDCYAGQVFAWTTYTAGPGDPVLTRSHRDD